MKMLLRSMVLILLSVLMMVNNSVVAFAEETETAEEPAREGFILGDDVRMRNGPGYSYGQFSIAGASAYYYDKERVTILEDYYNSADELWRKVSFVRDETEYTAWVRGEYCEEIIDVTDEEFEAHLEEQGFPETYRDYLRWLHQIHPNWTFNSYMTGIDWQTAVNMESRLGYSLVDGSDTRLRSTAVGAYDVSTGKYIPWDGNNWYCANSETVAYYMDPRNFINQVSIFSFLDLGYKESETTEVIQKTVDGTFMSGTAPLSDKTYAQIFYEAGQNNKISGLYLSVLARIEQGSTGSAAVTGQSFTYNGKEYSGLYNFFNIGAVSDAENWKLGLVYANGGADGANTSYNRPWNSPERAINGGAEWIADGYICDGQNTMYLMKFNVTPEGTYGHQYMTNIRGVYFKSDTMFWSYHDTGNTERDLTFSIPVFENMPEYTVLPGQTYVPQNKDEQAPADPTIEPDPEPIVPVASGDFIVDLGVKNTDGLLSGFNIGTTVGDIKEVIDFGKNLLNETGDGESAEPVEPAYTITIMNGDQVVGDDEPIGTGYKLIVEDENGTSTYTVIIKGDVNGDGKISVKDLLLVKKDILEIEKLEGEYLFAALADGEEGINLKSYKMIKKDILGIESVPQ